MVSLKQLKKQLGTTRKTKSKLRTKLRAINKVALPRTILGVFSTRTRNRMKKEVNVLKTRNKRLVKKEKSLLSKIKKRKNK